MAMRSPLPGAWFSRLRFWQHPEQMMSINRVVFCLAYTAYLMVQQPPNSGRALIVIGLYAFYTAILLLHVIISPAASPRRRTVALIADIATICYQLHLGGEMASIFCPLLLWTVLGNGLRFGLRTLVVATLLATMGFAAVVATTPFWQENLSFSTALLAGMVMLPTYAGVLLKSLSVAKQQAEAANQAKSLFLAGVSHELRTPLHAVIASGSLLRGTKQTAEQADLTRTIHEASQALLALIDDLLNFSHIETGDIALDDAEFDLLPALADVRAFLLPTAQAKGVRIALHCAAGTPRRVSGDERHLRQVLLNLASNAVKFTGEGGVLISVAPANPSVTRLRFEVIDTGIGIAPQAHERIFERFTQADHTIGARFGGTGQGLAICKRLIEALGGEIGLSSTPGAGSCFWFELDLVPLPPAQEAPPALVVLGTGMPVLAGAVEHAPFEAAALPERIRASAGRGGPALLVAPATPADARALAACVRGAAAMELPALVVVLTPAVAQSGTDMRWTACTALPPGFGPEALDAALATALALTRGHEAAPEADTRPVPGRRTLRVLVADDNRVNQKVVAKILDRGGHRARMVPHGEAALDELERDEYDVVLMDVNMPVMDGLEATRLFRVISLGRRHVPIIGLTADATAEMAANCKDAGMDLCAIKPVEANRLLELIDSVVPPEPPSVVQPEAAPEAELPKPLRTASLRQLRVVEDVVFDTAQVENLRTIGGDQFVAELLAGFLEEAAELIAGLSTAVDEDDLQAFRFNAHAMASTAANIGAVRVSKLGRAMERFSPGEFRAEGRLNVGEMTREVERLADAMASQGAAPSSQAAQRRV